jgi:hypothetical protein
MRDYKDENYHKYAVKEGKVKLLVKKIPSYYVKLNVLKTKTINTIRKNRLLMGY